MRYDDRLMSEDDALSFLIFLVHPIGHSGKPGYDWSFLHFRHVYYCGPKGRYQLHVEANR